MNVAENNRYEKYIATAGQNLFVYNFPVYEGESVVVLKNSVTLSYGTDYTVSDIGDTAGGNVTLTIGAQVDDIVVVYGGTPEARTTQYTGTTVEIDSANASDNLLTFQSQQLRRDIGGCLRNSITDGQISELPSIDERSSNLASWSEEGDLTYLDPENSILNTFMVKSENLSDVDDVEESRDNLGLGDAAIKNVGLDVGNVAAATDSRFLTSAQKGKLIGGTVTDASSLHTHTNLLKETEKGAESGLATLDSRKRLTQSQVPTNLVKTATSGSVHNEIVVFNGTLGSIITNSRKQIPSGSVVGTSDAQTLTSKSIDVDYNNVSNIEVDNFKDGVVDDNLENVSVSHDTIPSAKAAKEYSDTKAGSLSNLGTGVGIGYGVFDGDLKLRTIKPGIGIAVTQSNNDLTITAIGGTGSSGIVGPSYANVGGGEGLIYRDVTAGSVVNLRTVRAGDNVTIATDGDEIEVSVAGLGEMAYQDSNSISITGGNISGITNLAIADGGTGAGTSTNARDNLGLGTLSTQDSNNVSITGGTITGITDLAVADGGTGADNTIDARYNLGLGSMAVQDSNNVTITGGSISGGSISGITDLAIEDGGTGAGTASGARTNLGLGTISTQDSDNVNITGGAISGVTLQSVNGIQINEFSIDGTLAGNSDIVIPTERAIKTYTDTKVGEISALDVSYDNAVSGLTSTDVKNAIDEVNTNIITQQGNYLGYELFHTTPTYLPLNSSTWIKPEGCRFVEVEKLYSGVNGPAYFIYKKHGIQQIDNPTDTVNITTSTPGLGVISDIHFGGYNEWVYTDLVGYAGATYTALLIVRSYS